MAKLSFSWSVYKCKFPESGNSSRVLIIADPQLTDFYSYKQSDGLLLNLTQFISDFYMKKSFSTIIQKMNPEIIVFLGDLMDGGREIKTELEYLKELSRFHHVFKAGAKKFYMAGNHDIGVRIVEDAYKRFTKYFQELNQDVKIGNTNLVLLDSIGLLADKDSEHYRNSFEFLNRNRTGANILFTHIPLYREEGMECGSLRNGKSLKQGRGYQYLNLIPQGLSAEILRKIDPVLTFSGDDHDDCVFTHDLDSGKFIEHTLPTFSWLQGNFNPGFGVLQVDHSVNSGEIFSNICLLPSQIWMYRSCIIFLILTIIMYCWNAKKKKQEYQSLPTTHGNFRFKRNSWSSSKQNYSVFSFLRLVVFVVLFYFILIASDYYA
jgi:predicted MPP superfamily phosphohydrolase